MKHPSLEFDSGTQLVSRAMRAIRKKRDMSAAQVAAALGLASRTYEEFESGRVAMPIDRIFDFAEATNCDPFALILEPVFQMPGLGLRCANTKLVTIMMMHLEEFASREGDDIEYVEPPHIIGGLERLFQDLSAKLAESEAFLQNYLDKKTGWIGLKTLRLRGVTRRGPKS